MPVKKEMTEDETHGDGNLDKVLLE